MLRSDVAGLAKARTSAGDPPGLVLGSIDAAEVQYACSGTLMAGSEETPSEKTLFEIGSITKVFIALALAKLVQRQVLSLTDPVQEFLDDTKLPSRGSRPIRVVDLATHTAALPQMPDSFDRTRPWDSFRDFSKDDLMEQLERTSLDWDVGTSYLYSNVGYALLGLILEKLSGTRWDLLVKELILDPLGMTDTGVSPRTNSVASSHQAGKPVPFVEFGALAPAGALKSTAHDLAKLAKANLECIESGVSPALELARKSHFHGTDLSQMGLGWHIQSRNKKRLLWHRGETLGQTSFIGILPDEASAVVMLANSAFGNCCCDLAVWQVDDAIEPKERQKRELLEREPSDVRQFEGVYEFAPQITMKLTAEQDHLSVEVDGARGGKMYAVSGTEFITKDERVRIKFVKTKDEVVGFSLMQHGIEQFIAKRSDA